MLHSASVEGTSGIRGRISCTQVDLHKWEVIFGLKEAAHMFKTMAVGEISLPQLFACCFFFCSAGLFFNRYRVLKSTV